MIRKKNVGTRRMSCRLTAKELVEKREELSSCAIVMLEVERRHERAKDTVKLVKAELDIEAGVHKTIAVVLETKEEDRPVDYDHVLDYEKQQVIEIRRDTEEVSEVRDMTPKELQMDISVVGDAIQDPADLERAVVLYFDRSGRAKRVEIGGEDGADAPRIEPAEISELPDVDSLPIPGLRDQYFAELGKEPGSKKAKTLRKEIQAHRTLVAAFDAAQATAVPDLPDLEGMSIEQLRGAYHAELGQWDQDGRDKHSLKQAIQEHRNEQARAAAVEAAKGDGEGGEK